MVFWDGETKLGPGTAAAVKELQVEIELRLQVLLLTWSFRDRLAARTR